MPAERIERLIRNVSMQDTNTGWLHSADFLITVFITLIRFIVESRFLMPWPGSLDWLKPDVALILFDYWLHWRTGRTITTLHDPVSGAWDPGKTLYREQQVPSSFLLFSFDG